VPYGGMLASTAITPTVVDQCWRRHTTIDSAT
jgi:hypothetical protein